MTEQISLDLPSYRKLPVVDIIKMILDRGELSNEQMVGRGLRGERFGGTATCHVVDLEDNYRAERPQLGYKRFRALWLDR